MIVFAVIAHARPAIAKDERFCVALLPAIQEAIDARAAGHSEKALLASMAPNLKTEPKLRKISTAMVHYVYSVDKQTLPRAMNILYKNCLEQQ